MALAAVSVVDIFLSCRCATDQSRESPRKTSQTGACVKQATCEDQSPKVQMSIIDNLYFTTNGSITAKSE